MRGGYRNFNKNNNSSSNFSRNDRRNDRSDDNYRSNDTYKRPADKFNRNFSDNKKPRRDYDIDQPARGSFNQDRRDSHGGNRYGGNDRSFQERSFRDQKSYRNHTPPRSRDYEGHSESRFNRSSAPRFRQQRTPPPSTSTSFRSRNDFQQSANRSRPARGGMSARRGGIRPTGTRMLNRNDLRSGLITKRTAPIIRSKEYIKKIKQARLKISEASNRAKTDDEPKTPPKESDKESKHEDADEDFLDVANDVNFEEDDDETLGKSSTAVKSDENHKATKEDKEEKTEKTDKTSSDKANTSGTVTSEKGTGRRERSVRSPSKENDKSNPIDLNCVHCLTKSPTVNDFRYHLTRRTHLMAMKKVSLRARLTLNRLRKVQRDRQLEIEARLKNVENIPSKYCQICKLYFRQSKIEHRESEDHKKIRNFLKPYCKICHVQLLSAMKYEIHRCTLEHLRKKAKKHETSDDEIDLHELDLAEFKTVDSVGDVDGEEVESALEDDEFDSKETAVGMQFVNKIEVNYCSLCREYLNRNSKDEKVIADHCKSKKHLKWYYQSKKRDEKILAASKEKKAEDSGEASKEDVTSTSVQESDKASKKQASVEKEAKAMNENSEEVENIEEKVDEKATEDEEASNASNESPKKFTRYFEEQTA